MKSLKSAVQMLRRIFNVGRASIAAVGRPLNDRTNRYQTFTGVRIEELTQVFSEAWALGAKGVWRRPASLVGKDQHGMSKVGID